MDDPVERRRNRMREKLNRQKDPPAERRRPPGNNVTRTTNKDESLFGKRALALSMLAPILLPIVPAVVQMLTGGMKQFKRTQRYRNMFLLLWLGLVVCSVVKQWRSFAKYVLLMLACICFYPTWQVYQCSPRHLMNSDLGTAFDAKVSWQFLMDDAYYRDDCVRRHMRGPTALSLISPSLTLQVSPFDIVILDTQTEEDVDDDPDAAAPPEAQRKRYLFTSKRSVQKSTRIISLIVEAPSSFTAIDDATQAEHSTLMVTGRMAPLKGSDIFALKKQLEKDKYIVRPMVFVIHKAKFEEGEPVANDNTS